MIVFFLLEVGSEGFTPPSSQNWEDEGRWPPPAVKAAFVSYLFEGSVEMFRHIDGMDGQGHVFMFRWVLPMTIEQHVASRMAMGGVKRIISLSGPDKAA